MTRFIAGILACLLAQALGWPALEAALLRTNEAVKSAYTSAETTYKAARK